jgi:hypothetical protein
VTDPLILEEHWPDDLEPELVPFATRTKTVLRRAGLYDDPGRFNTLTVAEVAGWWNTGTGTIADLRTTAHAAIRQHHTERELRVRIAHALEGVAAEPWARTVWRYDPRFTTHLPKTAMTVYDIATTGSSTDRRYMFNRLPNLREAVTVQAVLTLTDAVAEYVELITGQHSERLAVLLARTGLDGHDPISGPEAGERLGVTYQRIAQLEEQLANHRNRTATPGGIWMPQVAEANLNGWPQGYTNDGIDAITAFVAPHPQ